jgi:hypothetical protein
MELGNAPLILVIEAVAIGTIPSWDLKIETWGFWLFHLYNYTGFFIFGKK